MFFIACLVSACSFHVSKVISAFVCQYSNALYNPKDKSLSALPKNPKIAVYDDGSFLENCEAF